MKRLIALFVTIAMLSFFASCSSCKSTGCSAAGDAYVKSINDLSSVIYSDSSKKSLCDLGTLVQSAYGASCKIAWN